jgi:hypothetical protein
MSDGSHAAVPRKGDVMLGLLLLGGVYGVEWALRRMPRTRAERMAAGARQAGHAARTGSVALIRFESDVLERNYGS